jgi:hypothetical protein
MDVPSNVDAAAAALGLKIAAEYRPGVERFHALAAEMAALLEGLPLTPADESGNVFHPVAPEGGE